MATINLVGAGLSSVSVGGAVKRTTTIGGLAMTPPPSITPQSVAAAVRLELSAELGLIDVAISTRATPTQAADAVIAYDVSAPQTAGSVGAMVQETLVRVAAM